MQISGHGIPSILYVPVFDRHLVPYKVRGSSPATKFCKLSRPANLAFDNSKTTRSKSDILYPRNPLVEPGARSLERDICSQNGFPYTAGFVGTYVREMCDVHGSKISYGSFKKQMERWRVTREPRML
jgi:hypothetical protein